MIGERVKYSGVFDGVRVAEESATVVAIERGGTPATWSVLVVNDAGKFRSPAIDLIEYHPAGATAARDAEESLAALEYLERWINEQFPGVEDAGGGPIERATQLLSQLKTELLEVGGERDKLVADLAKAKAEKKAKPPKAPKPEAAGTETPPTETE